MLIKAIAPDCSRCAFRSVRDLVLSRVSVGPPTGTVRKKDTRGCSVADLVTNEHPKFHRDLWDNRGQFI